MWLIDVHSYQLRSFPNHDAWRHHPYAILSHTWGEDEVTFQDMGTLSKARGKAGFWKIERTCEQARLDDLRYAWVDTCCIDKSSSAELQEAINSMFQWYARASICYAYLSDARVDTGGEISSHSLVSSRWFTRSWTLQELIAPRDLVFYGQGWTKMGTKVSLQSVIAHRTGIDREILEDGVSPIYNLAQGEAPALTGFTVAKRMSWAAYRQTTRIEDRAYSLLGIFGVNMPLLYGEGGSRAFNRLQEAILRATPDISLLLWEVGETFSSYKPDPNTDERYQSLLAPSPDLFSECGSYTYELNDKLFESAASLNISSVGVQVRLPIIVEPDKFPVLILLNCFDQLDPTRTIALRAQRVRLDKTLTAGAVENKQDALYLYLPSYQTVTDARYAQRTERIDAIRAEQESTIRDVVLIRYDQLYSGQSAKKSIERTKDLKRVKDGIEYVWLRLEFPTSTPSWIVLRAYPEKSWNLERMTFDAMKWYDNEEDVPWSGSTKENNGHLKASAPFLVGAIALQRPDLVNCKVVIAFACLVGRRNEKSIITPGHNRIYVHNLEQDSIPATIDSSFLQSACQMLASEIPRSYDWEHRSKRFAHPRVASRSRLALERKLYGGPQVSGASVFSVVPEIRRICKTKVAVLHAHDMMSPENSTIPIRASKDRR